MLPSKKSKILWPCAEQQADAHCSENFDLTTCNISESTVYKSTEQKLDKQLFVTAVESRILPFSEKPTQNEMM